MKTINTILIILFIILLFECYLVMYLELNTPVYNPIALNGQLDLKDFNGYCDYGWSTYREIRPGCGERLAGNIEEKLNRVII